MGQIIVGSTKYAGELISLPLINSTATKVETVSRMIHGENIVPLMQTAADNTSGKQRDDTECAIDKTHKLCGQAKTSLSC